MRVGLIARADRTGLAAQTWSFWKNMRPDATLVVDLSHCSRQQPEMQRYDGDPNVMMWSAAIYPSLELQPDPVLEAFLDRVDVVFTCETPYSMWLFQRAREKGVRTVLQPNYEFLEYAAARGLPEPDVFALPSPWHETEIRRVLPGRSIVHLPVPVDRELLPHRRRTELSTLLHTAGTPAMEDRNGTLLLMEAMQHVTAPVRLTVRTQKHLPRAASRNVIVDTRPTVNYWDLYQDEDLYVMPRKFGGLCLPMQEALACGMPVLTTAVPPQNEWFPPDLLVEARPVKEVMTRAPITIFQADPRDIAKQIDWLHSNPERFAELSDWADLWATGHSWDALRPVYEQVLAG
jgi:glycosyltransferase involved in cell wall biosynthesis